MAHTCPICHDTIEGDLVDFLEHGNEHIIDEIKKKHPEWVKENGICPKCVSHYQDQLKGE